MVFAMHGKDDPVTGPGDGGAVAGAHLHRPAVVKRTTGFSKPKPQGVAPAGVVQRRNAQGRAVVEFQG